MMEKDNHTAEYENHLNDSPTNRWKFDHVWVDPLHHIRPAWKHQVHLPQRFLPTLPISKCLNVVGKGWVIDISGLAWEKAIMGYNLGHVEINGVFHE